MTTRLSFFLAVALFLVACQGRNEPAPVVVAETPWPATHTPAPTRTATATPSPTPSPSATRTSAPTLTVTPRSTPTIVTLGVISGTTVNVRGGPGVGYPVIGQASEGTIYPIIGRDAEGGWWKVCCPVQGTLDSWISADFLMLNFPRAQARERVPLAESPPTPVPPPVAVVPPATQGGGAASVAGPLSQLPGAGNFGPPGALNPLSGLPLAEGRANQRPIIVCINNDAVARPQAGTGQADVMYEYIMEGYGITRFSGIFYGAGSGRTGPVRSARLINHHLSALYDGGTACSGASDGVRYILKRVSSYPYLDVDLDDGSNTRYTSSVTNDYRTRVVTSVESLRRWLADWEVERAPRIRGFTFGALPAGGLPGSAINVPYPRGSQVSYTFDAASGRYWRFLGGAAHRDGASGSQITVENVIVQYAPHDATDIVEDSLGNTSIRINLFGRGQAVLFRDGQAFEVTWRSESQGDMPRFYDAAGNEIPLKPGRSWISVVPLNYRIGYQ